MTKPIRILYVDDEADIRGIIDYALEDEPDIVLESCESGQEALNKAGDFQPDLILLDVMMPGMDGPTTLKKLRELTQTRTTPVIFVTAKVQPNEVEQFKSLGAIDVIAKPFDPISLAAHLRKQLELATRAPAKKRLTNLQVCAGPIRRNSRAESTRLTQTGLLSLPTMPAAAFMMNFVARSTAWSAPACPSVIRKWARLPARSNSLLAS